MINTFPVKVSIDTNCQKCCIVNVKGEHISHLVLYYKGYYYDTGYIDFNNILSYPEITVD